jgi:hypothetical protein
MTKISIRQPKFPLKKERFSDEGTYQEVRQVTIQLNKMRQDIVEEILDIRDILAITKSALSSDPDDPDTNNCVIWQSDGTGSGDDGDLMVKITDSNGTTKTGTLIDFSSL